MHTNIFPTFTIKDKAAVLGQRPICRGGGIFFALGGACMYAWCCCCCVLRGGGARGRGRAPRPAGGAARRVARRARRESGRCVRRRASTREARDTQQTPRNTQAQPLLDKCVEDTKAESGCLYYGWTVKEDGSKLFCRETYVDGAAAGEHLSCVAASGALGEALEKGYIALDNIDVMGTEADLAAAKKVPEFEAFGCGAWTVWDSFQNFKKTSVRGGRRRASTRSSRPSRSRTRRRPSPS